MDTSSGFTLGLVVAALLLGLRHGIDWDHIVAISDISATQESKRRGIFVGTLYVLGHAGVVILLGLGAIALGATVPDWLDAAAGRIVGVTLIVLGLVVVIALIMERGSFRARSRWIIVFETSRKLFRRDGAATTHVHDHVAVAGAHHHGDTSTADGTSRLSAPTHAHEHSHDGTGDYSTGTATAVGAIHGVGAETPTQIVVFLAAASAGGVWAGVFVLLVFVVGLVVSNSAITIASVYGFSLAGKRPSIQIAVGAVTATMSIGIGIMFLTGSDAILPAFFAG